MTIQFPDQPVKQVKYYLVHFHFLRCSHSFDLKSIPSSVFSWLQKLVHQPTALSKYSHLLLDEVHERSMECDLLLLVVRELLKNGWAGKLILMSATLEKSLLGSFPKLKESYFVGVKRHPVNEVELEKCVFSRPPQLIVFSCSRF